MAVIFVHGNTLDHSTHSRNTSYLPTHSSHIYCLSFQILLAYRTLKSSYTLVTCMYFSSSHPFLYIYSLFSQTLLPHVPRILLIFPHVPLIKQPWSHPLLSSLLLLLLLLALQAAPTYPPELMLSLKLLALQLIQHSFISPGPLTTTQVSASRSPSHSLLMLASTTPLLNLC